MGGNLRHLTTRCWRTGVARRNQRVIKIRYTPVEGLDLSGSPAALRGVHDQILELCRGSIDSFEVLADSTADPHPYDRPLERLRVRVASTETRISVVEQDMEVTGSRDSLEVFASWFRFEDDARPGSHLHHEPYEWNRGIHPESIPLVVGVPPKR